MTTDSVYNASKEIPAYTKPLIDPKQFTGIKFFQSRVAGVNALTENTKDPIFPDQAMIKKIVNFFLNGITGWFIGILTTLVLSFFWLNVIPVIDRTGQGPGLPMVILILMEMVSPFSIVGGFLGGMIPKEGGRKDQAIFASILSAFLTTPVALFLFWYTGF